MKISKETHTPTHGIEDGETTIISDGIITTIMVVIHSIINPSHHQVSNNHKLKTRTHLVRITQQVPYLTPLAKWLYQLL